MRTAARAQARASPGASIGKFAYRRGMLDARRCVIVIALAACGGGGADRPPDAAAVPDGPVPDGAGGTDGPAADAALAPFGVLSGMCGVIGDVELDGDVPLWFAGEITFDEPYDDPADRPRLTPGGQEVIADGNAGGSSIYSEAFAMEWLARCEAASLIKTETEIVYTDPMSKKADLLVDLDGRRVGVSVTRAVTFPFGEPYTLAAATTLIEGKLDDLQLATAAVSPGDAWTEQMLSILAYDAQHAQVAMDAWSMLDAQTRGSALVIVTVTSGDDMFIYTDQ
jgi:hypothetical protein